MSPVLLAQINVFIAVCTQRLFLQIFHDVTQLGCGNADCYGTGRFSDAVKTMRL
jgi:hypothetical protein